MRAARHVPRIRWKRAPRSPVRLAAFVDAREDATRAEACVRSLRAEWERDGRRDEDLEIVVLVRSGAARERDTRTEFGVSYHCDEGSRGAVLERALEATRGAARDLVAFVSADVEFRVGSVRPLIERLQSDPDCGAVAPRRFLDEALQFQRPEPLRPTPLEHVSWRAAQRSRILGGWWRTRRHDRQRTFWTAIEPLATDALAPACVWMRRKALSRTHGLFHAARAGRMADGDLLARVMEAGYALVYEPRACVVDASCSASDAVAPAFADDADRRGYVRRHATPFGRLLERVARWLARGDTARGDTARGGPTREDTTREGTARGDTARLSRPARARGVEDLGALDAPPVFELGRNVDHVVEIERESTGDLRAGAAGHGAHCAISEAAWRRLEPGGWLVRAHAAGGRSPWIVARFDKVAMANTASGERVEASPESNAAASAAVGSSALSGRSS